jgi:hypothetical protein
VCKHCRCSCIQLYLPKPRLLLQQHSLLPTGYPASIQLLLHPIYPLPSAIHADAPGLRLVRSQPRGFWTLGNMRFASVRRCILRARIRGGPAVFLSNNPSRTTTVSAREALGLSFGCNLGVIGRSNDQTAVVFGIGIQSTEEKCVGRKIMNGDEQGLSASSR